MQLDNSALYRDLLNKFRATHTFHLDSSAKVRQCRRNMGYVHYAHVILAI